MAIQPVRQYGKNLTVESEWIVARITDVGVNPQDVGDEGSIPHGWQEQKVNLTGYGYSDADQTARYGTTTIGQNQAFQIGGGTSTIGQLVMMRPRGVDQNGYPIWEFMPQGGGGGECNPVTSVQCTGGMLVVTYGICP